MKKHLKTLLIAIGTITAVVIAVICWTRFKEHGIKIDENEECVATMYYSYMLGMDAGTEDLVYIYNLSDSTYKYVVYQSQITIAGPTDEKEYKRGVIKSKNELIKLDDYFMDRKVDNAMASYSSYYLRRDDPDRGVKDINTLAEELFD